MEGCWWAPSFKAGCLLTFSAFGMGTYSRWELIQGWVSIRINTVYGSNLPPPTYHCPRSAIQWVMDPLVINPEFSSVVQTHPFSVIGAAMQDKKD